MKQPKRDKLLVITQTCRYCQQMEKIWHTDHNAETLEKAAILCKQPHWLDFVQAQLDWVDHADFGPYEQIRLIVKLHDETGCPCWAA